VLLTALGASLSLLAHPGSSAAASSGNDGTITASVRYGCPDEGLKDGFVEVALQSSSSSSSGELVLQVGLAGAESTGATGVFLEGGPSLVSVGDGTTKVRLAGDIDKADHVFIHQVDQPDIVTLPLHSTCRNMTPINFGLDKPSVQVAKKPCTDGSLANVSVSLHNPNEVDSSIQRIGYQQLDYTVLLVREDGQLADPVGTLLSFDKPSTQSTTVSQVAATTPTPYQVRVIGVDGAVTSTDISLSCSAAQPAPPVKTPTPPPTKPAPPTTAPPTTAPPAPPTTAPPSKPTAPSASVSISAPAPSGTSGSLPSTPGSGSAPRPSAPRPSASASQSVGAVSGNPSRPATSESSGTETGSGPVVIGGVPSQPRADPPTGGSGQPVTSPSRVIAGRAPGTPAPTATPSPTATQAGATRLVVEPPPRYGAVFVFQKDVALVVLAFAAAMSALVGATVVSARRR